MMRFSVIDSLKKTLLVKPHPAGHPFIIGAAIVTLLLALVSGWLALVGAILTGFCLYFFRDPQRVTPQLASLVIAPADGIVSSVTPDLPLPTEIASGDGSRFTRISIFLSVLDVHVNRVPVSGIIVKKFYRPGKFFNADLDKASDENERCSAVIETAEGVTLGVVQIAGLIARRIINQLDEKQNVTAGARFGIIRFGSRVDIFMPAGIAPLVCVGQRAVGGETILADLNDRDSVRTGRIV